ncbi:uncharacterized protein LOC116935307 [Daphnia magna]|uniref:uncharacterized protein LOC116935307 n=1 Tax=Daphnia magna TaxID=35525 RepID=UPI001E1BB9C1|nr:uncharacterized protein LOC116935307 [Daphnia magna]
MYKSMTLLVLVALAACVVSMETQDQEAAEQYYSIHGVYPKWYTYRTPGYTAVQSYPYLAYAGYPSTYTGYPSTYTGYPSTYTGYPSTYTAGIKNVVSPYYAAYPYGYNSYPYAAPYIPYVAPAAPAAPAKA